MCRILPGKGRGAASRALKKYFRAVGVAPKRTAGRPDQKAGSAVKILWL